MRRERAAQRLAAEEPAGLLYGALVTASVLVTASTHIDDYPRVAASTSVVLVTYFLAHVYIAAQTLQLDGHEGHAWHRIGTAARRESSVLKGGVPAIVVYVGAALIGVEKGAAASLAAYFSIGMLVLVGYLAAHRAGRTGASAAVDALIAGLFGVVVVVAKALLH